MSKGSNGKVPYSPTLDKMFGKAQSVGRVVQWTSVDPESLYRVVVAVNRAGGSVLFGATRDRGAWAITVWHPQFGDKPRTEYCNSEEMLSGFVADFANIWEAIADELMGALDAPKARS